MASLTKRIVEAAKPKPAGDYFLWCSSTPGFGVRVHPSGKRVFVAQVRVGRVQRRVKIGAFGPFTVEQARKHAEEIVRAAAEGRDPQIAKSEARDALSVSELCDLYLEDARAGLVMTRFRRPKRPSTVAIDEGRVTRHIKPLLGHLAARDLTRAAVQRMADDIAKGKTAGVFSGKPRGRAVVTGGTTTAARVVELLGGIYSWAEKRGHVSGSSPVRGVETAKGDPKDRVLTADELKRIGKVIDENDHSRAALALRLVALTGLRREEACALKWREIDFHGQCVGLETSKTGRSMRPIGKPVIELLRSIHDPSSEWVFPNRSGTGSADLKKGLAALFEAASVPGARSHDLRRTFASIAADEGYSDATIGELLGHARRGITARHYIRRPDAALIAAADRVSQRIADVMAGKEMLSAEVVSIQRTA